MLKTLRALEYTPVFLACLTNCGSVHNREKLFHIIDKKLVEQPLVSLL
ncbi:hypothetical protein Hanom_Chr12g01146721 [Helianthus anomalus]